MTCFTRRDAYRFLFLFLIILFELALTQHSLFAQQHSVSSDTIFVKDTRIPAAIGNASEYAEIRTPKPGAAPRINGPRVYGCRPGNPFLFRIPATGNRPMVFKAKGLPAGLVLDKQSGIISGTAPVRGQYLVKITAFNAVGDNSAMLRIVSGDSLNLTPPMGWNNWYAFYGRITDRMMREAADHLVSSGMADYGYQYVNIDDCWMNAQKSDDQRRVGPARDTAGNILPNAHFPDMKGLTDYIHAKGLKAGVYSSPGLTTCAGFTGSLGYEAQDARQFAEWGFDFLKYDYCSYEYLEKQINQAIPGITSLQRMQRPYLIMGDLLKAQKRDISLNLCQYGRNEVWKWGALAGTSWRTAGDLGHELNSLFEVALKNAACGAWSGPSSWNDPDYIQLGFFGDPNGMSEPSLTRLHPEEQYSFMSLWSLMAAPLFYSGDLTKLNAFSLNILCNTEVIDINQDALGRSASVIMRSDDTFVMIKELTDGSRAIGLCNKGRLPATVAVNWDETGLKGRQLMVRDVWRQLDIGRSSDAYSVTVPARGVVLIKVN